MNIYMTGPAKNQTCPGQADTGFVRSWDISFGLAKGLTLVFGDLYPGLYPIFKVTGRYLHDSSLSA